MKKGEVLALALIGVVFVGMTLLAFGNPIGVFVVGGALMSGQLMINWYDTTGHDAGRVYTGSDSGNLSCNGVYVCRNQ